MPRALRYDHEQFGIFLDYHRGCTVRLSSIGPPCMTMVLTFYHPDKNAPQCRRSELWCFPEAIQLPAIEWLCNVTISQPDPTRGCLVVDDLAGVHIQCLPDTWMRLMVHDDLAIPGLDFGQPAE